MPCKLPQARRGYDSTNVRKEQRSKMSNKKNILVQIVCSQCGATVFEVTHTKGRGHEILSKVPDDGIIEIKEGDQIKTVSYCQSCGAEVIWPTKK